MRLRKEDISLTWPREALPIDWRRPQHFWGFRPVWGSEKNWGSFPLSRCMESWCSSDWGDVGFGRIGSTKQAIYCLEGGGIRWKFMPLIGDMIHKKRSKVCSILSSKMPVYCWFGGETCSPSRNFVIRHRVQITTLLASDLPPDTPYLITPSELHPFISL